MPRGTNIAVCTATFSQMWLNGTPTRIISETLKISADKCDVTRRQLGLPPRECWHGSKAGRRRAYLPTIEEIKQKCLEFQAGWSEEERARRRVGWNPDPRPVEIRIIPERAITHGYDDDGQGGLVEDLTDMGTSGV